MPWRDSPESRPPRFGETRHLIANTIDAGTHVTAFNGSPDSIVTNGFTLYVNGWRRTEPAQLICH